MEHPTRCSQRMAGKGSCLVIARLSLAREMRKGLTASTCTASQRCHHVTWKPCLHAR